MQWKLALPSLKVSTPTKFPLQGQLLTLAFAVSQEVSLEIDNC
jgi:hypothetical protein